MNARLSIEGFEASSALPARALGSLYVAGATIGAVSLLLPHPAKADVPGLWSNVGLAYAGAAVLLVLGSRMPRWLLQVSLVAGTLLIARAVFLSGEAVSFYSVWFIWVGLYVFYFFSRPVAAAHVALVSGVYAWTLFDRQVSSGVARWLTTVATLIVAGVFIDMLVRRARRDATAAATSAKLMARVADLAHELSGVSESAAARPALCHAAARVTHADGIALWEPIPDGSGLARTGGAGWEPPERALAFTGRPAGVPQAFTTGKVASSLHTPGAVCSEFDSAEARPGACLWQPIVREHRTVAVLACYWKSAAALTDPSVFNLSDLLAVETAVTLERVGLLARLESIARTDELTGLPNRRAWQEELARELPRSRRSGEPLCVAMLDLDHFKRYNDQQGHQAGDRLLKRVAGAWTAELRATDILVRYGGEEFALALPGCGVEDAMATVERLRAVIPSGQTCSAGIACWDGEEMSSELLDCADRALYEAKRSGRDRTVLAQLSEDLNRESSSSSIE
ncbi:MAG TPA: GGDEF domain-containing protein [Solirubrobacteraceae bacterium]|nr:GGDEF domain-containing protein [Solirubrobacteraceae bacterium]